MKNVGRGSVHWSFWLIGGLALIWNALGGINFFAQINARTFVLSIFHDSYVVISPSRIVESLTRDCRNPCLLRVRSL